MHQVYYFSTTILSGCIQFSFLRYIQHDLTRAAVQVGIKGMLLTWFKS